MNHFSIKLWCMMKNEFYDNWQQPTQWLDQEETPKHFPKLTMPPLPKMVMVTGGLLLVWFHYNFLNPRETTTSEKNAQQIDEIHWKPQCLQLALINRMGPILLHYNARPHITWPVLQKLNKLGYKFLPHLIYWPNFLRTFYHFFKHLDFFFFFPREETFTTTGCRKFFPRFVDS